MPKRTIDLTPSWGEWANIYRRFAESGQCNAIKALRKDHARMAAFAAALCAIKHDLPPELSARVDAAYREELAKQGE
ncbi:hypothetical protein ISE1_2702 [plant metagenome]|uniref:Uncharacterized protein n=1 Tax=plant metagenome TaxID=1297885 RepID=A0A484UI01_9ZZZZ